MGSRVADARRRRGRPPADRRGRRGRPARRRQRGRRRAGGDAHLVRRRAAAHRARAPAATCSSRRRRREPVLLDFFVAAPGRGADPRRRARRWSPVDVVVRRRRAGVPHRRRRRAASTARRRASARRRERFGTLPLAELAAPAAALAREGVAINAEQAYVFEILDADLSRHAGVARAVLPGGPRAARGRACSRDPELATRSSGSAREGAAPFYAGDIAARDLATGCARAAACSRARTSPPTRRRRASRCASRYRGREVLTNPPPSAGGILIAYALALLERDAGAARRSRELVAAMERAQAERTPEFLEGLAEPGFLDALHRQPARLDDAHLGARRRRLGVLGHVHERRGLRRRRARHRHPRQQHDGRAGPLAARLLHPSARAGGCRR